MHPVVSTVMEDPREKELYRSFTSQRFFFANAPTRLETELRFFIAYTPLISIGRIFPGLV